MRGGGDPACVQAGGGLRQRGGRTSQRSKPSLPRNRLRGRHLHGRPNQSHKLAYPQHRIKVDRLQRPRENKDLPRAKAFVQCRQSHRTFGKDRIFKSFPTHPPAIVTSSDSSGGHDRAGHEIYRSRDLGPGLRRHQPQRPQRNQNLNRGLLEKDGRGSGI